jgi:phage major head subunit gpT-like protein
MKYDFFQLKDAINSCTAYDLQAVFDDDHDQYILVDPYGDVDGDPFYELDDVYDYITNNEQVAEYLAELDD